ncbi:MAG TPA: hypothetical protein DCR43_09155 [Bacteroidales bacterium]|nr:MAG: hypothetical protein A2X09_03290 [Bacteroidetes bacterium GWF2_43_11]HAQ66001.1 hypothetical protein [Bacteroidales bacterium]
MPKKKKNPDTPATWMFRTFFALCPQSGQLIAHGIDSVSENASKATITPLSLTAQIFKQGAYIGR